MGEHTEIGWCDATFNPWWGCARVSPGCEHCYAELAAKRYGHKVWGRAEDRRFFGEKHWLQPSKWNERAERDGRRVRVFCASMCDVFESRADVLAERHRLFRMVDDTPALDWLFLTKRPENLRPMVPSAWLEKPRPNVWLGTTCENQMYVETRATALLDVPAKVRFLSVEPMLGPVRLDGLRPDWVIIGGESGPGARSMQVEWAHALARECQRESIPVFMKQLGAVEARRLGVLRLDPKASKLPNLPDDLRLRAWPEARL